MKAVVINTYGGPDVLRCISCDVPVPGPGDVLVAVAVAGVNFIDTYVRSGLYKKSDTYAQRLPLTIGMEAAGVVRSVGEGVSTFSPGDRVAYCLELGAYAEFAVVPAWKLVRVPDDVPFDAAATLQLQGATAHYLSHSLLPLGPEHTCLVHAGAGGLGLLLIQLAKARGARVITTVGSPEKAALAQEMGADHAILYRDTDFAAAVLELTEGIGVDVVYDSVGRDTIEGSLKAVRTRGMISNNGNASGAIGALDPLALAEAGSVYFTRPHLADYIATAADRQARAEDLFALYLSGDLRVRVDRTLELESAADAHRLIEARATSGKVLLSV